MKNLQFLIVSSSGRTEHSSEMPTIRGNRTSCLCHSFKVAAICIWLLQSVGMRRDPRLPLWLNWIFLSSGLLLVYIVGWFRTDVSLRKRRFWTNLHCVISQTTEEFGGKVRLVLLKALKPRSFVCSCSDAGWLDCNLHLRRHCLVTKC
jgi:hypothetical protein